MSSGCSAYEGDLVAPKPRVTDENPSTDGSKDAEPPPETPTKDASTSTGNPDTGTAPDPDSSTPSDQDAGVDSGPDKPPISVFDPLTCSAGDCWWSHETEDGCRSAGAPSEADRPVDDGDTTDIGEIYFGWSKIRLGTFLEDGTEDTGAWQTFGLDLDGTCTNSAGCDNAEGVVSCLSPTEQLPFDGQLCRDNTFASLQPIAAQVPEIGANLGISETLFNCELWHGSYNVISRISGYNGTANDAHVRVDFYTSDGLEVPQAWQCPRDDFAESYPLWRSTATWHIDEDTLTGEVTEEGRLPDSTNADADAYVRDGYLIARAPDGTLFRLAGNAMPYRGFPLRVAAGYWIGNLQKGQDGTWSIRDGMAAGRIRKEDLIQGFREAGFCPGQGLDTFYDAMVTYVEENADVLADGTTDPERPCDAMSMGIAYEAKQITPGSAGPIEPLIECCPPGMSAAACLSVCGDGAVSGDEQCDTAIAGAASGACPSSCQPLDACTPTQLMGTDCDARCEPLPITARVNGDGCCPDGANSTEDTDCVSECDNGVVEPDGDETCDPIASCPTSCESPSACLEAVLVGAAESCDARCDLQPITACNHGDGCCPDGCTRSQDDDCSATCGDGELDANETCENGSDTPCPSSCDDGEECTNDVTSGSAANCNVTCGHSAITALDDSDGCCPPGANANTDDDCTAVCGNGTVEPPTERCDGNCPTSCNDNVACTANNLVGTGCNRRCEFPAISQPANGDGCCPSGGAAHANNDSDCPSVCGNGEIEPGEGCDDENDTAGDGCSDCQIESSEQICLARFDGPDECEACNCRECTQLTMNCHASPNATLNMRCDNLIICGREESCTNPDCYCGTASLFGCLLGGANGPCMPETEAAAESNDPYTIYSRTNDTSRALGRATLLVDCASQRCAAECDL